MATGGEAQTLVDRPDEPLACGAIPDDDSRCGSVEALEKLSDSSIRATVVDDDEHEGISGVSDDALETLHELIERIVNGNENRRDQSFRLAIQIGIRRDLSPKARGCGSHEKLPSQHRHGSDR